MLDKYPSVVVVSVSRLMVPAIQIFALYVITHGHYSPGGGFQGGVLLAASTILLRITQGRQESSRVFPPKLALPLAAVGVLVYLLAGLVPVFRGGVYLDYSYLPPANVSSPELRYFGILIVEIGVALAVWGTLVAIFDQISHRGGDV